MYLISKSKLNLNNLKISRLRINLLKFLEILRLFQVDSRAMLIRPRRNRRTPAIRSLVRETELSASDLVAPVFVIPGDGRLEALANLPGVCRMSIDLLLQKAEAWHRQGIQAVALFPSVESPFKDENGSGALREEGLIPQAVRALKREIPSLAVITDIALDPFTTHGHDGLVDDRGRIVNDASVDLLAEMAVLHAACGADFVAPSDMMDGRIGEIRRRLDEEHFEETGILAYSSKYASSLYAPFREALHVQLAGDKKTYQMDPANAREALREAALDEEEGADILMVKPALFYLDVISRLHSATNLPIAAYHVSGEYAMVMAAHEKGYVDASKVFVEAMLSIKRAGATLIFTYAVDRILEVLRQEASEASCFTEHFLSKKNHGV